MELTKDKVLIVRFNPFISSKTGKINSFGKERPAFFWRLFEDMLIRGLYELGVDPIGQLERPDLRAFEEGFSLKIFVHKTKREQEQADAFYMQMHLPELFTFDFCGWGADSFDKIFEDDLDSIEADKALDFSLQMKKKFLKTGGSKHVQPKPSRFFHKFCSMFNLPRRFILVPLQTPRDYVIKQHSPVSVVEFIKKVSKWAIDNEFHVLFKSHPFSHNDQEIRSCLEQVCLESKYISSIDGNIHNLIQRSAAVWVINSGVGFEALFHNKPVITEGNCDYKMVTFDSSKNISRIKDFINSYDNASYLRTCKFLYYYYFHHSFSVDDRFIKDSQKRLKRKIANLVKRKRNKRTAL